MIVIESLFSIAETLAIFRIMKEWIFEPSDNFLKHVQSQTPPTRKQKQAPNNKNESGNLIYNNENEVMMSKDQNQLQIRLNTSLQKQKELQNQLRKQKEELQKQKNEMDDLIRRVFPITKNIHGEFQKIKDELLKSQRYQQIFNPLDEAINALYNLIIHDSERDDKSLEPT